MVGNQYFENGRIGARKVFEIHSFFKILSCTNLEVIAVYFIGGNIVGIRSSVNNFRSEGF